MDYPNDGDGDALRRVAERSDMSKPMDIDFALDVPSKRSVVPYKLLSLACTKAAFG